MGDEIGVAVELARADQATAEPVPVARRGEHAVSDEALEHEPIEAAGGPRHEHLEAGARWKDRVERPIGLCEHDAALCQTTDFLANAALPHDRSPC